MSHWAWVQGVRNVYSWSEDSVSGHTADLVGLTEQCCPTVPLLNSEIQRDVSRAWTYMAWRIIDYRTFQTTPVEVFVFSEMCEYAYCFNYETNWGG